MFNYKPTTADGAGLAPGERGDLEQTIQKLALEDGDVIVVRSPKPLRQDVIGVIRMQLHHLIDCSGKKAQVLVLDDGLSIEVLKLSGLADREVSA